MSTISRQSIWSDTASVIGGITVALGALAAQCVLVVLQTAFIWQQRAHDRHQLATLDDQMMADMGISRADIDCEMRKPFWRI